MTPSEDGAGTAHDQTEAAAAALPQIPDNAGLEAASDDLLLDLSAAHGIDGADRADTIAKLAERRQAGTLIQTAGTTPPPIDDDADLAAMEWPALALLAQAHGIDPMAFPAGDEGRGQLEVVLRQTRDSILLKSEPAGALEEPGHGGAGDGENGVGADVPDPAAGALDEPEEDEADPAEPKLGDTVYLFERNVDPTTSEPLEGYQEPKAGTLVALVEETGVADIRVGGETSAPETSQGVPYRTQAEEGQNYWSETSDGSRIGDQD